MVGYQFWFDPGNLFSAETRNMAEGYYPQLPDTRIPLPDPKPANLLPDPALLEIVELALQLFFLKIVFLLNFS